MKNSGFWDRPYLCKNKDGRIVVVSEPSPDVAQDITTSLGLSAKTVGELVDPELKAAYAIKAIDLASRSQTLQILRESLYRLSEMSVSSDLTVNQKVVLFNNILKTVSMIAATEFANSDAPIEVKEATLKKFLEDIEESPVNYNSNQSNSQQK